MPESERTPKHDADDAADFFDRLRERGVDERIAAQLTSAYILGKLRQSEPEKPDWQS